MFNQQLKSIISTLLILLLVSISVPLVAQLDYSSIQNKFINLENKPKDINSQSGLLLNDDDEPTDRLGFWIGYNIGAYFANKYHSKFYNGDPNNVNNINYILKNKYHYEDIKRALNNYDFHLGELPSKMKYSTAYTLGFMFKYNIKNDLGFFFQFNTVKLNISDKFSLIIDSLTFTSEDAYRLGSIYGTEKRTNFDLGVCKTFSIGDFTNIFAEFGFNLNNTKVLTSKIKIENLEYSLINVYLNQSYVPNTSLMEYNIQQGGIGYGLFFTGGVQLIFSETISLDPGISVYYKTINLEGYQAFKLHFNIFIRFSANNIL